MTWTLILSMTGQILSLHRQATVTQATNLQPSRWILMSFTSPCHSHPLSLLAQNTSRLLISLSFYLFGKVLKFVLQHIGQMSATFLPLVRQDLQINVWPQQTLTETNIMVGHRTKSEQKQQMSDHKWKWYHNVLSKLHMKNYTEWRLVSDFCWAFCICTCSVPYTYFSCTCMGCLWAIFLSPYAYGLPVHIRPAHTGIAGILWFAHMRMSACTRMHICPIHSTSS